MAYQTYNSPALHSHNVIERAGDWIVAKVRAIGDFYAEQGRVAQLAALDRRTLQDIGIHRSEIASVAHNQVDPTRRRAIQATRAVTRG